MAAARGLLVLYGSQTGCAEEVAEQVCAAALRRHLVPRCLAMEDYDVHLLPTETLVICVASTTGEGEVPDNMRAFWRFLLRKDLPAGSLAALRHATFGLGDSSYPKYNFAAKRLHRRLEQLGSAALVPLGMGDDQDDLGVDQALTPWLAELDKALDAHLPIPDGLVRIPADTLLPPLYEVSADGDEAPPPETPTAGASFAAPPTAPSRQRPFLAPVLRHSLLTSPTSARRVYQLELGLRGSSLAYAPGDALAVAPRNDQASCRRLLAALQIDADARVLVRPLAAHAPPLASGGGAFRTSALELFCARLDVFAVPRRGFFALLAHFAKEPMQKERLLEFAAPEGAVDLRDYATRPRRTIAEVLLDFDSCRPPLCRYLELVPPLRERYFSIASSPALHPEAAHLCYALVEYRTTMSSPRRGVCTSYLASLHPGAEVAVWLRKGCLRLPEPLLQAPLLMVGPGTGVAPFRAFVQHRQAKLAAAAAADGDTGDAAGDGARQLEEGGVASAATERAAEAMLFFGCRKAEEDFLYRHEWAQHLERGSLQQMHCAFSRDQPRKVYVQHLMRETPTAEAIWRLLASPAAHVYIAGAANQMPKDVRGALCEVAVTHGGLDEEAAAKFLKSLEAQGRLQCETW